MDLKTLRDEFDRIAKKRELSTTKYHQLIDMVEKEIKEALSDLQSADDTSSMDHKSVIEHLKGKFDAYSLQEQLKMLKEDHEVDLNNYPEILGKVVETDISKAFRNEKFDSHIVNRIILNLFYQEGLFDVADIFLNESKEPGNLRVRSNFSQMHEILDALNARNLEPALSWLCVNRRKLYEIGSTLEFDLRRLQFLEVLKKTQFETVRLAQTHLFQFANSNRNKELFDLMICLFSPENLETPRYSYLLSPEKWKAVSQELTVQLCGLMKMSFKNPLAVVVEAGAEALPTYLENANTAMNWEFPVDVELGREFQFHSVFICPVNWEECDNLQNPPMMLLCGHVFSWKLIWTLSKGCESMFQCPICRLDDYAYYMCRFLRL